MSAPVGHNIEKFDLSLVLDRTVLRDRLNADYGHRMTRASALLVAFDRFKVETENGIKDEHMLARAGEFYKQIRDFIAVVGTERKEAKKPIDEAAAEVQAFFARRIIDPLTAAMGVIDERMKPRAEIIQKESAETRVVSDQGVSTGLASTPWRVEVIDLEKVPLHYLVLNEAAALAALKSQKALAALKSLTPKQQPIAGLRFYRDTRIDVR